VNGPEWLWDMGYGRLMGYGKQIPAYRIGGLRFLWGMGGYGLYPLWVKRGPTVIIKGCMGKGVAKWCIEKGCMRKGCMGKGWQKGVWGRGIWGRGI